MRRQLPRGASLLLAALLAASASLPSAAPLEITAIQNGADGVTLTWADAATNRAYTVQTWDGYGAPFWIAPRINLPWPLTDSFWLDTQHQESGRRFYRVAAVPQAQRGLLLSRVSVASYSQFYLNFMLSLLGLTNTVNCDVQVWKLDYETIDPLGGSTWASGALALPQGVTNPLPLLSYQHGTVAKKSEAPSGPSSEEQFFGAVLAGFGYAVALPDYLGLGDSLDLQSYHHAASEATAAVDMLRATRAYCAANGIALTPQLFLLGYSQGGHATMALHRELEEYHSGEFTITASAPMAGAYDLSGVTLEDALSGRPMPNPYYFALLMAGYQSVYHLADSLPDLLAPPYHTLLPHLLDGQHSGDEINAVLTNDVTKILAPACLAALRNDPHAPLRQALYENDLYRWTPHAPMRMYHCEGDADVLYANSVVAWNSFHARGATQVELIDPQPTADHGGCVIPSLLLAKQWFDSLRQ